MRCSRHARPLIALTGVVLMACTGGPAASAEPTAPGTPPAATRAVPSAVATAAPATEPPSVVPATATPLGPASPATQPPDASPRAVDVATLIPEQVGDIPLDDPTGFSGQEFFDASTGGIPENVEAFNDFLARLGSSVEDLSGAATSGFSESGDYVYVTANRVAGADGDLLLSETIRLSLESIPNFNSGMAGTATEVTLGDKTVTKIVTMLGDTTVYDTSYYYGYGDTIFKVSAISEDVAAEALSLLP